MECHFSRWKVRQTQVIFVFMFYLQCMYELNAFLLCEQIFCVENLVQLEIANTDAVHFYHTSHFIAVPASRICEKVHASSNIGMFRMNCSF